MTIFFKNIFVTLLAIKALLLTGLGFFTGHNTPHTYIMISEGHYHQLKMLLETNGPSKVVNDI